MKMFRKRVFAAVLAALMLAAAMPVTALYALAETGDASADAIEQEETEEPEETVDGDTEETEEPEETVDGDTEEPGTDDAEETGDGDTEEPGTDGGEQVQEPPADTPEENTGEQEDTGICKHHQEHGADCGYIPKSEDGEGSPCTYECRICPVEDLIAALPEQATEDNAADVRGQLDEILALYGELNEDEQEEIDLSRCYALQGALDAANAPMAADGSTEQQDTDEASVTINGETLYYATLEDAFAAANGQTATITMLNDAECIHSGSNGSPLNITSGNVTLNLNGKTLSGKGYGYYGIIDVSGGSLLVQGEESKVKVARRGLSCRGNGKLTVEGITLELVGDDEFFAGAGIYNVGGTVTLNGTQMTGAASDGQIYHYSGTTTINNVTATGVTENCPKSVWYHNEGTLTINGGTFDKIVVKSDNYGGVQSVAELLGEGYTYKKQDGTWATADDLAAMEISNVTVEKIPLTINPQGDTSWYYSTQQTHTLAMNAAPVNGSDSVTYVWKNGNEKLDCTSDAYTVPAGMTVGSYTYTCEATCDGYTLSHTFTFKIEKSGTEFEGDVKTYNGSEETTSFTADDTITVKATPTATGTAPQKAAARLRSDYTAPAAGEMALFVDDVQVSEPVSAGEGGTYTMTVSASEVLLQGNAKPNGNAVTLTAKFVENDNMADAAGTVDVNISAVAMAEKDGTVIGYYGAGNLADAFARNSGNAGATFTLLADVEPSTYLAIQIDCTLDLNGHTITSHIGRGLCVIVETNTAVTIRGEGEIIAKGGIALAVNGSVTLEGGTYTSGGDESSSVYVVGQSATLSVTGEKVSIRNTSGGYGLSVAQAQSVRLSAGTYSGTAEAISSTVKLSDMLANTDNIRYAFYQGSSPYAPSGSTLPSGTFTVKECQHKDATSASNQNGTHALKCPYCGYSEDAVECAYIFSGTTGTCAACGDSVTVAVSGTDNLIYDGTGKEPGVTIMRAGTELTAGTDYTVAYADNTNAGENKATVTVTIGNGQGSYTGNFSIGKATPTITWSGTSQELTYSGSPAVITAPTVTLVNGENFSGAISYSCKKQGEAVYRDGLPADAGIYTVKAHVDAAGNYAAADSTKELKLTISYLELPETILYNGAAGKNCYGRSDVAISAAGYTVSDAQNGGYQDSYTIPVPAGTGTVTRTLYFSKDGGKSAGVEVTVRFDLTPPAGKVKVGTRWWEALLKTVTFGHYAAKTYTVTIESNDTGGSGIGEIRYAILYGDTQYTDAGALASAAGIPWTEYAGNSKPEIPIDQRCVVYAKLTDQVGNVSYISTEGILLDKTPPAVGEVAMTTVGTRTAAFAFSVDEAADYYYVVLPGSESAPAAEDIIAGGTAAGSAASGRGEVKEGQLTDGKAAVNVTLGGLTPGREYTVYVTAVDRTVDLETGAAAGNIQKAVKSAGFTMEKLTQAAPALSYTRKTDAEGKITLAITEITGAEYSFNGGTTWKSGEGANVQGGFTTSDTVTLAVRLEETATHYPSPAQTLAVDLSKEDREAPPAFRLIVVANGETDYTVTIPSTEGCEYSFDGEHWSGVNGKAGVKAGETVTGYMRYRATDQYNTSGAVSDTATMPKFTGKTPVISPSEGGHSGGGSGGEGGNTSSGNAFGENDPGDGGFGNGDAGTTPVIPVNPPAAGAKPVEPGTGNAKGDGTGTRTGSGSAEGTRPAAGIPFIKGENGKSGWDVIRTEEEQAQEGGMINVDMNGTTVVPGDIFDRLRGRNITITFDMGNGILWSVDGKSITTDRAGDIDFSVKTGGNAIPPDVVKNVAGKRPGMQVSLAHEGEFGFTAVLSLNLGRENAGYTASLYYYSEGTGELAFICADEVAEDGTVSLAFTHASDYLIAIDRDGEESGTEETAQTQTPAGTDKSTGDVLENSDNGQQKKNVLWIIAAGVIALAGIVFAGVSAVKKKEKNGD